MSIYGHSLVTDLNRDNNNLYIENHVSFNRELDESNLQPYIDELTKEVLTEKIDMDEGFGGKLRPVFICLTYCDTSFDRFVEKFVKDQTYWHASIGFGPALSRTYSFNFGEANANNLKGGLSFESMEFYQKEHPNGTCEVSCIFLKPKKYKQLKETLEYYIRNKEKTRYSFMNLVNSFFGRGTKNTLKMDLVCSSFVDTILRSVNINISGDKATNLTKPDDLKVDKNVEKHFKLFEGKLVDYDPKKIQTKVDKLSNDVNNDFFKKNVSESVQNWIPVNKSSDIHTA